MEVCLIMHVIASSLHRLRGTDNLRFNNEKMGYLLEYLLGIVLGILLGILLGPDRINVDYMTIATESMLII